MLAAHEHRTEVTLEFLQQSIDSLMRQLRAGNDFLRDRRPIGLSNNGGKSKKVSRQNPFGFRDELV